MPLGILTSASLSFHREEGKNLNAEPPQSKDGRERNRRCTGGLPGNTEGSRTHGPSKLTGHACVLLIHPKTPQANTQSVVCLLHVNRLHQGAGKVHQSSTVHTLQHLARRETKHSFRFSCQLFKTQPCTCQSPSAEIARENLMAGEVRYTHMLQGSEGL